MPVLGADTADARGMVSSVSVFVCSITPALISVSIHVRTLMLPVPSALWLTVRVVSKMVLVVFCGSVNATVCSVSVPPLMVM